MSSGQSEVVAHRILRYAAPSGRPFDRACLLVSLEDVNDLIHTLGFAHRRRFGEWRRWGGSSVNLCTDTRGSVHRKVFHIVGGQWAGIGGSVGPEYAGGARFSPLRSPSLALEPFS